MGSRRWAGAAALALIAAAGCADGRPKTYRIPGKVTYSDGAPVPGGTVVMQAVVDGKPVPARGEVKPDGSFELGTYDEKDGVVAGEHQVSLLSPPPQDGPTPVAPPIPRKYGEFETSGLKTTVTPETKEIVLTIERPGPAG